MTTLVRARDPATSKEAAADADRSTSKELVRFAIETFGPCSAKRLEELLADRKSPESVRGAIAELSARRAGRRVRVWDLVRKE